ncbi:MAG TPA: 50S ribosomal protein L25 [Acidimicrobiales bacterium]|nr:50S ribosomal protein L25 [Acidimicrobiales bacterium]
MSQVTLHASTSRAHGSANSRRLRHAGSIPGVIYGEGVEALPVSVNAKDFRTAVSGEQGLNSLITLDADGTKYTVMAREIQRHPVKGTVAHVDFQVVDPNQAVIAEVPLHLIGDAVEVRHADWEVDQQMFSIEVRTRPDQIPNFIEVDISGLSVGAAIRVGDLVLPSGVEATGDLTVSVVATHAGRAAKAVASTDEAPAE